MVGYTNLNTANDKLCYRFPVTADRTIESRAKDCNNAGYSTGTYRWHPGTYRAMNPNECTANPDSGYLSLNLLTLVTCVTALLI